MTVFTTTLTATINQTTETSARAPFIQQLSSGDLPLATFRYYLIQDNHYLTAFNRLHQEIATYLPANEGAILSHLGEGEDAARQRMHREIGLGMQELQETPVAPNAYSYITHMYYQLDRYGAAAATAGLLPCYWLYSELAQRLAVKHSPVHLYQEFFDSYTAADFTTSTEQMKAIVNQQAASVDELGRQQMTRAFQISCYYEEQFWQMAFDQQGWR